MYPDINCDMDKEFIKYREFMPLISSANIFCGYSGSNRHYISEIIGNALFHNMALGALVSYEEQMQLLNKKLHFSGEYIYQLVLERLCVFQSYVSEYGSIIHHIKLFGALYNLASTDAYIGFCVAKAVKDFDDKIIIYGLIGSSLIQQSEGIGLQTKNEIWLNAGDLIYCLRNKKGKGITRQILIAAEENYPDVKIDSFAVDYYNHSPAVMNKKDVPIQTGNEHTNFFLQ